MSRSYTDANAEPIAPPPWSDVQRARENRIVYR